VWDGHARAAVRNELTQGVGAVGTVLNLLGPLERHPIKRAQCGASRTIVAEAGVVVVDHVEKVLNDLGPAHFRGRAHVMVGKAPHVAEVCPPGDLAVAGPG
jgi:hypothetical protein